MLETHIEKPDVGTAPIRCGFAVSATALAAKNQLTAADARLLQVAFELRLSALLPSESSEPSVGSGSLGPSSLADDDTIGRSAGPGYAGIDEPTPVDKSGLVVDHLRRLDKAVRERRGAISRTDSHCP